VHTITCNANNKHNNHTNIQFKCQAVAAANQVDQSSYQTVHSQVFDRWYAFITSAS